MPYTLKTQQIAVKDPDTGVYSGVDVFAEQTTEGLLNEIEVKGATVKSEVDGYIADARDDIDQLETDANTLVANAQAQVIRANNEVDTLTASITSAIEDGVDRTLERDGVPADAKAAGDSIRDLKSTLDVMNRLSVIDLIYGYYIPTDLDIIDITDIRPSTAGYSYAIVDCKPHDVFTIFECKGGSSARLWTFIDENKKRLTQSASNLSADGARLIAPANASKLIINTLTSGLLYKGTDSRTIYIKTTAIDLNNLLTNGTYLISSAASITNLPPIDGSILGILKVFVASSDNIVLQQYYQNLTGRIFNRSIIGKTIYNWHETTETIRTELIETADDLNSKLLKTTNTLNSMNGDILYEWNDGSYVSADGEIIEHDDYHYSCYIPINSIYPAYQFFIIGNAENISANVRIHVYDGNKNWLRQKSVTKIDKTNKNYLFNVYFEKDEKYFVISCSKTRTIVRSLNNLFAKNNIVTLENAYIKNMSGLFAKPTINTVCDIQQGTALTAKTTIYKNGDYYCCIFQQNLNGTSIDVPSTEGNGIIALCYKKFKIVDGVESDVTYGTIAQKGSTYIDYEGNSATFVGGVGKPSGNNRVQFCTAAAVGEYNYNGTDNYGMTPCAFTVDIDDNGNVTFGEMKELTLNINGNIGKFDVIRINSINHDYYVYYTLTAPAYDGTTWHWIIPTVGGMAYFTSTNAFDWTYVNTIETPFQAYADISCENLNSTSLIFAARIRGNSPSNPLRRDSTIVGVINKTGYIIAMYKLPGANSRSYFAKIGNDRFLLFTNLVSTKNACCLLVTNENYTLKFYEWFNIYGRCTWYISCYKTDLTSNFSQLYIVGTDGQPTATRKSTFMILDVPSSPRSIEDVAFMVN